MDLHQAIRIFAYAALALLIFALLWWTIEFIGLPPPFGQLLRALLVVLGVLVLVGFLLRLAGPPASPPGPPLP